MAQENEFEWEQFSRLGEMIGAGLHYEEPWISKEYKRLQKILIPETEEEKAYKRNVRKQRNESIDKQISKRLHTDRCSCGATLKQVRSGSKVVKCENCNLRYKYSSKRK